MPLASWFLPSFCERLQVIVIVAYQQGDILHPPQQSWHPHLPTPHRQHKHIVGPWRPGSFYSFFGGWRASIAVAVLNGCRLRLRASIIIFVHLSLCQSIATPRVAIRTDTAYVQNSAFASKLHLISPSASLNPEIPRPLQSRKTELQVQQDARRDSGA